jgi:hypothetical protein
VLEIRGTTIYNKELWIKRARFHVSKSTARNVFYILAEVFLFLVAVAVVVFMYIAEFDSDTKVNMILIFIGILAVAPISYYAPILKAHNKRTWKKIDGLKVAFVCTEDILKIEEAGSNYALQSEYEYERLYRVYESADSFYFYISAQFGYIFLKNDIEDGAALPLRAFLTKKVGNKKYINISARDKGV